MMKKPRITLDTLAEMVGRGFKEAQEDSARIREHLTRVDERVGRVEEDVKTIREDVKILRTDMEREFTKVNHRIDNLPSREDFPSFATTAEMKLLERRIEALERKRGRAA